MSSDLANQDEVRKEAEVTGVKVQSGQPFNYDDILLLIGEVGKFQLRSILFLCLPAFFPGIVILSYTFVGAVPDYRCLVEGCENVTTTDFHPIWLNNTMPENVKCQTYNKTWIDVDQCVDGDDEIDKTLIDCREWVFDKSLFESTIVTEFNLTCGNEWKQTLTNTMYMVGNVIGPFALGSLSDVIGRRHGFLVIILIMSTVSTATAFSTNYTIFTVLRFLAGVSDAALILCISIWGVESVGDRHRIICGFLYQFLISFGPICLGVVAYFVRDWRSLQLISSAPMFLCVFVWFLPESIRWLITKKKYRQARELIIEASKMNGVPVPEHLIVIPSDDGDTADTVSVSSEIQNARSDVCIFKSVNENNWKKSETIVDVFRNPTLCKRICVLFLAWIAAIMGYFGITFSSTNLAGDFFLNYELSMIVEIPSYILGIFVINNFGRRITLSGGLLVGGVACLITGLVPADPIGLRIGFSIVGKLFITCVFSTLYSYTPEMFPTAVRSSAVGLCSTFGRIGGTLAPLIAEKGRTVDAAMPYVIFACINLVVGFITILLLPETLGESLPATMEEAISLERRTLLHPCRSKKHCANT